MIKAPTPTNAQTSTNKSYAGGDGLWASEKYLVNYNQDLIRKLTKHQNQSEDVLEFGAGIGTLADLWHKKTGIKPKCVEIDPEQLRIIKIRGFDCYENLDVITRKFDLIYTSNVLEHIQDDRAVLRELYSKLKNGGSLVIYVPAFPILYSAIDEKVGHFRRYHKRDLLEKLKTAGFAVTSSHYSDSLGFFVWLYIKFRGYSSVNEHSKARYIYDKILFPLSKGLDILGLRFAFGKNLLVYAKKK